MASEQPPNEDPPEKRPGRLLYLVYLPLVVLIVSLIVAGVAQPHWVPWLVVLGALAVYRTTRVIPEVQRRGPLSEGHRPESVISNDGLDIRTLPPGPSAAETRLAVQDALDAVRCQRYTARQRLTLRIARDVAIVGALSVTVVAWAVAHDPLAAAFSAVVAAALGTSHWFTERRLSRAKTAETLLIQQLDRLDPPESVLP